mmetsp:Transcript_38691/g.90935  ORF Transcript_38691/g.90935 Transcript_38691/m.90935 type:complete len:284 (-) Transcript_38691:60-911(-)|eukprot:CAMPEP_0178434670 /NCGR_PEP_ID=MMETSP0689_2-20121128/33540_1 /TAXON_ID=160604 /ORGANISM="Amphidinium massartii, Strain CS-259" /LENGTH=283 /DNA_ID=CAMNT_0020056735 /DNA_START=53 /DNA_END=904 /DNA_ORIENTATION=+
MAAALPACDACSDARSFSVSLAIRHQFELLKALHHAAERGELQVVENILYYEDVDVDRPFGTNHDTALTKALRAGHLDFAKVLWLTYGAAPTGELLRALAQNGDVEDVIRCCHAQGVFVDSKSRVGFTPLMIASKHGHKAVVSALLRLKANVDEKSTYELTPLMLAAADGREEVARTLLSAKASVDVSNHMGWTSLHRAAAHGHASIARALLEARANPNFVAKGGETSLTVATVKGHKDVVTLLLSAGASPQSQDKAAAVCRGQSMSELYIEDRPSPPKSFLL